MVSIKAYYTNKRIANIDTTQIKSEDYRKQIIGMKSKAVDVIEIFAYIGLLIRFGLANKNEISIEILWSERSLFDVCRSSYVT